MTTKGFLNVITIVKHVPKNPGNATKRIHGLLRKMNTKSLKVVGQLQINVKCIVEKMTIKTRKRIAIENFVDAKFQKHDKFTIL